MATSVAAHSRRKNSDSYPRLAHLLHPCTPTHSMACEQGSGAISVGAAAFVGLTFS